jgi:hypothetical protein
MQAELDRRIEAGDPNPLYLAAIHGPVSVNPIGIYEPGFHRLFGPSSSESTWNSFNVGEFIAPASVWSLLPLLVIAGVLIALLWRETGSTPADDYFARAPASE